MTWRRILPSLKQMSSEAAELNMDLGALSAQQQKVDAMRFCHEQGGSQTSYCRRPCGDATTGAWDSEGTKRTVDISLVQFIDTQE